MVDVVNNMTKNIKMLYQPSPTWTLLHFVPTPASAAMAPIVCAQMLGLYEVSQAPAASETEILD